LQETLEARGIVAFFLVRGPGKLRSGKRKEVHCTGERRGEDKDRPMPKVWSDETLRRTKRIEASGRSLFAQGENSGGKKKWKKLRLPSGRGGEFKRAKNLFWVPSLGVKREEGKDYARPERIAHENTWKKLKRAK